MKKGLMMLLCLSLALQAGCSCAAGEKAGREYTPGICTARGEGYNGPVEVTVEFSSDRIEKICIGSHRETRGIFETVFERIPDAVLEGQTLAVDMVSGATVTSKAIMQAVEECVQLAGGDVQALKIDTEKYGRKEWIERSCDVVIVGAGGTGLSAAASALEHGVENIIVLEKLDQIGGSTAKAGGTIAAAGTKYQKAAGIEDSKEEWFHYWLEDQQESGVECQYPDEERLSLLMDEAVVTVEWLGDTIGMEYATPRAFSWGEARRAHASALAPIPANGRGSSSGGGKYIIAALDDFLKQSGSAVEIMTGTPAEELLTDDAGNVIGVLAESKEAFYQIRANTVVLAAGGFAHNTEMLLRYIPSSTYAYYADVSKASEGNTGDGIRMALAVGAELYEDAWIIGLSCLSRIEEVNEAMMTENLYRDACIVDEEGKRFVNEDIAYITSSSYLAAVETVWELIDSSEPERAALLEKYREDSEIVRADTWEELAGAMGADPKTLRETMDRYNEAARTGVDTEFHKDAAYLKAIRTPPYYAVKVCPVTAGTIGGVKTNEKFQVLRSDGTVIRGLYAGGECSNRVYFNRVYSSGGGLTIAITSGRIAGACAAEDIAASEGPTG